MYFIKIVAVALLQRFFCYLNDFMEVSARARDVGPGEDNARNFMIQNQSSWSNGLIQKRTGQHGLAPGGSVGIERLNLA